MVVAANTELSNDEVYYWTYALQLQWNYFDHPPLVALLIRFFTGNLAVQQEFFIRLGSIVVLLSIPGRYFSLAEG